jgi:hypothetical protein
VCGAADLKGKVCAGIAALLTAHPQPGKTLLPSRIRADRWQGYARCRAVVGAVQHHSVAPFSPEGKVSFSRTKSTPERVCSGMHKYGFICLFVCLFFQIIKIPMHKREHNANPPPETKDCKHGVLEHGIETALLTTLNSQLSRVLSFSCSWSSFGTLMHQVQTKEKVDISEDVGSETLTAI